MRGTDDEATVPASSSALDRLGPLLSDRVALDALLLVTPARPTRVLWSDGALDQLVVQQRTELGRRVLAEPDPADVLRVDDGTFGVLLRDEQGSMSSVLFAERTDARTWTESERAAVTTSAALLRRELLELTLRPRPGTPDRELEAGLRAAAARGELVLLYQPEIDLGTGQVLAVEALVRWDHPVYGRLGPDSFIQIAERSDLINVLGSWVIEQAVCEFAGFRDEDVVLRVNVSPAQLGGDGVVGLFSAALEKHDVPGSRVCVEFTETSASGEVSEFARTLIALGELGISTAMDDLATGYSTLSRLRTLAVDTIKIDRSLVSGIDADDRARAIVGSLLQLARTLDLDVVAEGVETADELHALIDLGCRRAQGHLLGRPQDGDDIAELIRRGPVRLP